MSIKVAALYRLVRIEDTTALRSQILDICISNNILGAITIASEGINGTIAGEPLCIDATVDLVQALHAVGNVELKFSYADKNPFVRFRVLLRPEIVTMGCPDIVPGAGTYVDATEWNDVISDPSVIVLDTRNDYEVSLGTFRGAINPKTISFKDFPGYVQSNLDPSRDKKIAMYCTGGIRCEKASSYMLSLGYEKIYHLRGGILKYLEDVPEDKSLWDGQCYVFDQRVSVGHGLVQGTYSLCRSCRHPLNAELGELQGERFEEGVYCTYCVDGTTEERKRSCRERQLQIDLAKKRGTAHLGTKIE